MEESNTILTNTIIQAINDIFGKIFSSVDNKIYELLDKITFINTDLIEKDSFKTLFGKNSTEGILLVCNALILGIIIFYSINYLISHLTYSKIQSPMQFIFKAIIFVGIMNGSLWICSQIINIIFLISSSICYIGKNLFNEEISFVNFISKINSSIYISNENISIASFDGIIQSFTTIGFVNLIFSYALRYIMIQVFILISPFSFLCLINDRSEWIFKSWIKAFLSLLFEQILISLILVLAFSFNISNIDTMSKILYIGIIYALIKANTYMYMIFGGITTSVGSGINMIANKSN